MLASNRMGGRGRSAIVGGLLFGALGCGSVVVPESRDGGASATVSVVVTGDGRVTSMPSGIDCPGTCVIDVPVGTRVTLDAEPGEGSVFAGFDLPSCGTEASCAFTATADRAIEATFEVPRARLRVVRQGDGQGRVTASSIGLDCGATCEVLAPVGTEVVLTAEPGEGSRFGAWSAPCVVAGDTCMFTLDADLEVRATFDERFATLSVLFTGSGTGAVRSNPVGLACTSTTPTCEATFEIPTSVTLTATPDPATTFVGWSESTVCSGRQPCTFPLQRSQTVTATFEGITHELTVTRSGPGQGRVVGSGAPIDCGTACNANVAAGTPVDLVAEPARHYRFVRWTGACSGTSPSCALSMDTPKTADAEFEFIPQLATGFRHACATSTDGRLRCWGANDAGQLGYGHMIDVGATPARTAQSEGDVPIDEPVEHVALGFDHTCVVLVGGRVRCWGLGGDGQLGYGDISSRGGTGATIPRLLSDIDIGEPIVSVTAGVSHSCALAAAGRVFCWGSNDTGQLGYGSVARIGHEPGSVPRTAGAVPLGGLASSIVAGALFTCARSIDATLRCWGNADFGQLGYGDTEVIGIGANNTPAAAGDVPVGTPVLRLYETLGAHVCVGVANDAIRCWGLGGDGRIGYGNENNVGATNGSTPEAAGDVSVGAPVVDLFAGGAHTCALTATLGLRCWGDGDEGQLGYGNPNPLGGTPATVPSNNGDVPTGGLVEDVGVGNQYTCVRYRNGDIKCWGACLRGVCGYGDQTYRGHTPSTTPANLAPAPIF